LPLSQFLQGVRQNRALPRTSLLSAVQYPDPARQQPTAVSSSMGRGNILVISLCMVAVLAEVNDDTLTDYSQSHRRAHRPSQKQRAEPRFPKIICGACALGDVAKPEMMADLIHSLTPITDVRASADYRLDASATLILPRCHACFEKGSSDDKPTMTEVGRRLP